MDDLTSDFLKTFQRAKLSFRELFPDEFILRNTHFSSLEEFMKNTGFNLTTQEALSKISIEKWDEYIKSCSGFSTFEEMKAEAVKKWIERAAANNVK